MSAVAAETVNPLLRWLDDPSDRRGIRFAENRDAWTFWSYRDLATLTGRMAAGYRSTGVSRGDVVALVQRGSPQFVAAFFGALAVGAMPVAIAPPGVFADRDRYLAHLQNARDCARPRLVVVSEALSGAVGEFAASCRVVTDAELLSASPAVAERHPAASSADAHILQFTSGSSGLGKAVKISCQAVAANCAALRAWLAWEQQDATASWLPVHHDMGLIACFITPVVAQSDLWLMQPAQFLRDPARYLALFGQGTARLTASPCFGLEWIADRVSPKALTELDFSDWRALVVGAELVRASVLERFHALLGPHGFDRATLLPAYGLAEATVAVAGVPLGRGWRELQVDRTCMADGSALTDKSPSDGAKMARVVGCGRPLDGVTVQIVDAAGQALADGRLGEVCVRGESVASGYYGGDASRQARLSDGVLRTGDAGMIRDGELYVFGRFGDSVKVHGRLLFAEDLEALLHEALPCRSAVAVGWLDEAPTVAVFVEQADDVMAIRARHIAAGWGEGARIDVVKVGRGRIPYTTSGKVRRSFLWRDYAGGTLDA